MQQRIRRIRGALSTFGTPRKRPVKKTKKSRKRKRAKRVRVPAWAEYMYDGPDYREQYLALQLLDDPAWGDTCV